MDILDQPQDMSRRVFVKGLGFVSLGLVYATMLGGCESIAEQIRNRPVRRRLRTGSSSVDDAIAIYKDAVTAMKALPGSDPRSWSAQSALHGSVAGGFNLCQHGTNHFFSWHRAYLFFFEKICQELTGEKSFGLPYWNWNQNPAMHPEFTAAGSTLNHPRTNTSVAGDSAFDDDTMDTILGDSNFFTFSSQLEGTPHNTVHILVGQNMASGGSPLDPVFWPHHCMVDYAWAKWNIELENDNPGADSWNQTAWTHFVDGQANATNITAGITTIMPLLSYRYESSTIGGFGAELDLTALSARDVKKIEARLKKGAEVRFDIKRRIPIARGASLSIARPYSTQTRLSVADFSALVESDARSERLLLSIDYARLPAENDFLVRVFINRPDADVHTRTDNVHFAGSFAFFGTQMGDHGEHHGKTDFLVNVTDSLQKLRRNGLLRAGEPLTVQLVAVPVGERFARPDMQLTLEGIELLVSPVSVRTKQE